MIRRVAEIVFTEIRWLATLTIVGCAVVTSLSFLAQFHWSLALLSNFRGLALSLSALAGLVLFAQWIWSRSTDPEEPVAVWHAVLFGAVVSVVLNGYFVWPYIGAEPDERGDFSVATMNVWVDNPVGYKAVNWARDAHPDILVVPELRADVAHGLGSVYAYQIVDRPLSQSRHMPVGLYTNYPVEAVEIWSSPGLKRPIIDAVIHHPRGKFRVLATHPIPAMDAELAADRNAVLNELARRARQSALPVVVAGDLNVTMWSPAYRVLEDSKLQNTRSNRGMVPTWPARLPIKIPIDHVLHDSHFETTGIETGPNVGSDHLPLVARLRFVEFH